ncbi:MAG: glycosyltransferase [Acidobacteria bacterium]|nr:glycosyltransferase [Acidobacteriota bacterium]
MTVGVAYIVGSFKSGGTETQLVEILRRLDRRRFTPYVLCLERRGGLLPEVEKLGVEVREMGFTRLASLRAWRSLRAQAAWMRGAKVRIVQGFQFHGALYGALLKRRCPGVRLIVCEQAIYGPNEARHRLARSFYYRSTDIVTANCEAVRRAVIERDGFDREKVVVIYGGVDIDRFRPAAPAGGEGPVIGVVGRLHPDKGQRLLVEAAPAIFRGLPRAKILLVGDGPQRGEIEARVRELRLDGRIELLGDRRDVPSLLAGMDLLVLPSASEGFANAALEGSSSGLPVVVSDVGGNPEIVEDGITGRVFRPGDAAMLASCVVDLLRDPDTARRAGAAGRRRIETMFPLAEMVRRHERLYDRILAGRAQSHLEALQTEAS